jgi:tetratricopeptide (TPR) repeat protein
MLTTKKWRGVFAVPAAVSRPGNVGCLGVLLALLVLVGCSPPGRRNLLLGERLIQEGRPAEAIEPLQAAVALLATNAPACAQAWNYLGLAYHYANRPSEAAQAYQNALTKDFNLVVVRFNRGCLFLEQGNLPGALNELTTYTTHFPKDALGWTKLGTAQMRARMLEPAERSYQRVLELSPSPPEAATALNNLGLCLAVRRRPNDAFKYFNAALKHQTNYPPALLNQAIVAQQQLNDRALALDRYRAYLEVAGPSPHFDAVSNLASLIEADLRPRVIVTNPPLTLVVASNLPPKPTNSVAVVRTSEPPMIATSTLPAPPVQPTSAPPATNVVRATVTPSPEPAPAPPVPPATQTVAQAVTSLPPPPSLPPTNQVKPTQVEPAPVEPARTVEVAVAPTPSSTPQPTPEPPPPPMEVVQLEPEPEVKIAADLAPPDKPAAASLSPPAAQGAPAPGEAAATAPNSEKTNEPKTKKKSFVQRLNPLGWFGGKDKEEKPRKTESAPTPLPSPRKTPAEPGRTLSPAQPSLAVVPTTATPATSSSTPAPASVPTPPTPPPAPAFPRYSYLRPGTPVAGDRARAEAALAEGVRAHKNGQPAQALAAYKRAVQADPTCFEAQYNLGVAAFDAAVWPEALAAFERALVVKPDNVDARLNFALALDRTNYPVDAAHELEVLLAAAPSNVDAHATLANLCVLKLADTPKARTHYTKVLQLDPNHPQAAAIRRWLAANQGRP